MQNNDLISRKALIEDLMNLEVVDGHKMYLKGCDHTLHGLVPEMVNAQPAADAALVVHGRWVSDESDVLFHCSVCETQISTSWDYDCDEMWNFCPHCGAKMDQKG